ncbi:MAG: hypothetical protein CL678_17690 [Bdellovibrionaceae bacterium]|nr:hypothetical protein [Pseudobdellovibrionaceae bacterium]|tara:strand:- start:1085 stop:1852 length:768 start_codon:yes stop_codon:yes gene_type:complete
MKFFIVFLFFSINAHADFFDHFWVELEGGPVWQTKNDIQIPSDTGTRFSLTQFGSGPKVSGRVYLGYQIHKNHELRFLWAPLNLKSKGFLAQPVSFYGGSFGTSEETNAVYQFNSYRLTYRYQLLNWESGLFKIGFTAKIRDAKIQLIQGSTDVSRTDVGFVPLLHLQLYQEIYDAIFVRLDADALAAPQGRAEDVAIQFGYQYQKNWTFLMGYRMLEGGAKGGNTGGVFNFTWLHYLTFGIQYRLNSETEKSWN